MFVWLPTPKSTKTGCAWTSRDCVTPSQCIHWSNLSAERLEEFFRMVGSYQTNNHPAQGWRSSFSFTHLWNLTVLTRIFAHKLHLGSRCICRALTFGSWILSSSCSLYSPFLKALLPCSECSRCVAQLKAELMSSWQLEKCQISAKLPRQPTTIRGFCWTTSLNCRLWRFGPLDSFFCFGSTHFVDEAF